VVENLENISLKKCVNLATLSQVNSQGFRNLRLVDLTEISATIVENCIQRWNLNNIKWLCLKKCMIWKLPSNLFYCLQLQVFDLAPKFRKHTFIYWPIECTPRIQFIKVFALERTTFIYWPIECTPKVWFVMVLQFERTTFIYSPIECIPKIWFVKMLRVEKTTFIYSSIECTPSAPLVILFQVKIITFIY
jgi:hypothetical protein